MVSARMRAVRYHIDADLVLAIDSLDGGLVPIEGNAFPVLDDPTSFTIRIDRASIAIDTASLSRLLDRYVFAYRGSSLSHLSVSVTDGLLEQRGRLHKVIPIPFTIAAAMSVTPAGEIRLEARTIKALGIGIRGLMSALGVELQDLVKNNRAHGVRVVDDVV
jgi:hypothetical protein